METLVFPTPVGMVRFLKYFVKTFVCFPHARGDGPGRSNENEMSGLFSPRPWGWSEKKH